jgi:hypothetical protein
MSHARASACAEEKETDQRDDYIDVEEPGSLFDRRN